MKVSSGDSTSSEEKGTKQLNQTRMKAERKERRPKDIEVQEAGVTCDRTPILSRYGPRYQSSKKLSAESALSLQWKRTNDSNVR